MADPIDELDPLTEMKRVRAIKAAQDRAASMPVGEPGECCSCGDPSPRLVGRKCAPCRDGR